MSRPLSKMFSLITILALMMLALPMQSAGAISPNVVISQVYGGGGNSGATFTHDFIELFNRGTSAVSLAGWSVQYASATGTGNFGSSSTMITELPAVSISPGQYFLIQEAQGAGGTTALPTPDVTDASPIAMAAGAGKVALVNSTTPLGCNGSVGQPCSAAQLAMIIDLVGYGNANFFEGAAAPTLSNTTSASRASNGCVDTDNNASDFSVGAPTPRNTASPLNPCPIGATLSVNDVSANEGDSGTTSFDFTVSLSAPAGPGGVTFDIATADDTATVADNDYAANSLTGQTIAEGQSSYSFSVLVNGDTTVEPNETFFVNVTNVTGATVADGQGQGTITNDDIVVTPIHDVQGSGAASPLVGQTVVIEGVVVGDFQDGASGTNGDLNGFHVQEEDTDADADSLTSEGIFVFNGSSPSVNVAIGDLVRVQGQVSEFNGLTEITSFTGVTVLNSDNTLPTAATLSLPVSAVSDFEAYEGMLVTFPQALYVSEYFNFDRFNEIVLTSERHLTPTAEFEPGAAAMQAAQEFLLDKITLDDGRSSQNPDPAIHPNGSVFDLTNLFRGGDTVANVTGVMDFSFGLYRIQPTQGADYSNENPRTAQPDDVGGNLKVASFNVLNYFTTIDTGAFICGPAGDQECRGADNAEEFTRQRDKIIAALVEIDADVVGLIEIENHPADVPTADLVSGLNDVLGAGTYDYVATGAFGTDAIRLAFIYKPASVSLVGDYAILDTSVDPRFLDDFNRPVLAQTFQDNTTGGVFTVAVNHLKSKGSDCNAIDDPDTGDGQGNCNLTRLAAAEALVDWLATDPTDSGDEDFLIIGDLNSYDKEDPIDAIREGSDDMLGTSDDYTDLLFQFIGEDAYSFVFDGQTGYLDHALAIQALLNEVTGATVWHINADEADLIDYDTTFKGPNQDAIYAPDPYRSSDHDPVIVGLDLVATCNGLPATMIGTPGNDVINGTNGNDVIVGLDGDDIINGGNGDDVICGNAGNDTLNGGNGNDLLFGSFGSDTLNGANGNDTLDGGANDDALVGDNGDDTLTGSTGADSFSGGNGADTNTDFNAEDGDTTDGT